MIIYLQQSLSAPEQSPKNTVWELALLLFVMKWLIWKRLAISSISIHHRGRIPSSKGYRFYVDDLLTLEQLSEDEKNLINHWYATKARSVEGIFRETKSHNFSTNKEYFFSFGTQLSQTASDIYVFCHSTALMS